MTSTWLQARIAEKPELADQLNADNVGRKQRLHSDWLTPLNKLFGFAMFAALVCPVELCNVLVPDDQERCVLGDVRLNRRASFVRQVRSRSPGNFQAPGEDDRFT